MTKISKSILLIIFAIVIVSAQTQIESVNFDELKEAESSLNIAVGYAKQEFAEFYKKPEKVRKLEKAHQAWRKFREAECEFKSETEAELKRCKIEMTESRTEEMSHLYRDCE